MREADKRAFERRIRVTPACWIWLGTVITGGYGRFHLDGGYEAAHRYSYRLYVGEIPEGLLIRHKCDNPICVNPEHLLTGTMADNRQDAVIRNRTAKGSDNGRATITEAIAIQIKDLQRCGFYTATAIAHLYGVKRELVYDIRRGKSWAHLP